MGRFIKGRSGNPGGKPKVPDHLKQFPEITVEWIRRIISKYTSKPVSDLLTALKDPSTPSFEAAIASTLIKAVEQGDINRLDFLLSRTVGKVKDEVEVTNKYAEMTPQELLRVGKEAVKTLEAMKPIEIEAEPVDE